MLTLSLIPTKSPKLDFGSQLRAFSYASETVSLQATPAGDVCLKDVAAGLLKI